jgi:hypothetical protein
MEKKSTVMTRSEIDFINDYRNSAEYQNKMVEWLKNRDWRVELHREPTDGRTVMLVQALQDGTRVTDCVIIEPDRLDSFIEGALECAERVRAANQKKSDR